RSSRCSIRERPIFRHVEDRYPAPGDRLGDGVGRVLEVTRKNGLNHTTELKHRTFWTRRTSEQSQVTGGTRHLALRPAADRLPGISREPLKELHQVATVGPNLPPGKPAREPALRPRATRRAERYRASVPNSTSRGVDSKECRDLAAAHASQ